LTHYFGFNRLLIVAFRSLVPIAFLASRPLNVEQFTMRTRGFACSLLLGSAAAVGLASSAYSFTITDDPSVHGTITQTIYYGGTNIYNNPNDIIGDSPPFSIFGAVISRSGTNNNTLNIIINTNFAGAPGTGPADQTVYGSLFLARGFWTPSAPGTNNSSDNYVTGNKQWSYAVTNPTGVTGNANPVGLYAIGTVGAATNYPSSTTPQYYSTADGRVYMSYLWGNGDPTSGSANPVNPNNGFTFRSGQAVQYIPTDPTAVFRSATFTTGTNYVAYSIVDNGLFGDNFALSWAMTCGNDIIQGQVILAGGDLTGTTPLTTPLPAALPLFAGGLGGIGLLARRRKRKNAAATVAA